MADRTVLVRLVADTRQFMSGMAAAGASASTFAKQTAAQTATAAKGMKNLGAEARVLPIGLSASTTAMGGLAIAAGASVKAAIDWETAWAGVKKTVDGSPEQMAALEGELRNLATTLPATHEEIAGVAEAAGQLGIKRENIAEFTRTMVDLGETTNLSAQEAATSLARFANVMGTSQDQFSNLGSSIVDLGNNFATTEAEIVNMAQRIAGAGRQIGMSEGDVLGLATALSSVGIEAEAGGTAISRVMIDMAKAVDTGSDKLDVFAGVAGQSVGEFSKLFREDAGTALSLFIEGLGRMQESGQSITPVLEDLSLDGIRVSDTMRRTASSADLLTDAMATGNDAFAENAALAEEAARRYETTASRIDVAKNAWKDLAITVGQDGSEAMGDGADAAALLANALSGLNVHLADSGGLMGVATEGLLGIIPGANQVVDQLGLLDDWWARVTGKTETNNRSIEVSGQRYQALANHLKKTGQAAPEAAANIEEIGDAAASAEDEVSDLASAIESLGSETLDARAANRSLREAVVEASKALEKNGKTATDNGKRLKIAGAAGRENAAALDRIAIEGKKASAAVLLQTGSQQKANAKMREARSQFISAAKAFGLSGDQARRLAREVGLIPAKKKTEYSSNAGEATNAARSYRDVINSIPRTVRTQLIREVKTIGRVAGVSGAGGRTLADGGWAGAKGYANAGWVSGPGTSRSDSIPAWLSNGEFVVNAVSARTYGPLLEAINNGRTPAASAPSGDTFYINTTTESVIRDIESRQRVRSLSRRRAVR